MALRVPDNLAHHIEAKDTQLIPLVLIGTYKGEGLGWDTPKVYISTDYMKWSSESSLPLLLNIPSLKESINISSREYKISSLNLEFSNLEYGGKRLSQRFSASMSNVEVRIFWASPDSDSIQIPDVTIGGEYQSNSVMQVYYGKIKKYVHDAKKVTLLVEDNTQDKFHKDLPLEYVSGDFAPDEYKNKPIPIVFGELCKAPCVFTNGYTDITAGSSVIGYFGYSGVGNLASQYVIHYHNFQKTNLNGTSGIGNHLFPIWIHTGTDYVNLTQLADLWKSGSSNQREYIGFRHQMEYETVSPGGWNWITGIKLFLNNVPDVKAETETHSEGEPSYVNVLDFSSNYSISASSPESGEYNSSSLDTTGALQKAVHSRGFPPTGNSLEASVTFIDSIPDYNQQIISRNDYVLLQDGYDPITKGNSLLIHFRGCVKYSSDGFIDDVSEYPFLYININFDKPEYDIYEAKATNNLVINKSIYNHLIGLKINGVNITKYLPFHNNRKYTLIGSDYGNDELILQGTGGQYNINPNVFDYTAQPSAQDYMNDGNYHGECYDVFNFVVGNNTAGSQNGSAPFQIWTDFEFVEDTAQNRVDATWEFDLSKDNINSDVRSIECMREMQLLNPTKYKFFADVKGALSLPLSVVYKIAVDYLNIDLDTNIYDTTRPEDVNGDYYGFQTLRLQFSINEKINSKKLINNISSITNFIWRFDAFGNFRYNEIPYNGGIDWTLGTSGDTVPSKAGGKIYARDVIDFSFTRTSIDDVYTECKVLYNYDYATKELKNNIDKYADSISDLEGDLFNGYNKGYYGLKEEKRLIIDDERSKYISNPYAAVAICWWLLSYHANQKLIIKLKLPLKFLGVEVADIIHFDELLGGIKPYNIDYTEHIYQSGVNPDFTYPFGTLVNGQVFTPSFIVTSTNKKLDSVEIECMHLPALFAIPTDFLTLSNENSSVNLYSTTNDNKIMKDIDPNIEADIDRIKKEEEESATY